MYRIIVSVDVLCWYSSDVLTRLIDSQTSPFLTLCFNAWLRWAAHHAVVTSCHSTCMNYVSSETEHCLSERNLRWSTSRMQSRVTFKTSLKLASMYLTGALSESRMHVAMWWWIAVNVCLSSQVFWYIGGCLLNDEHVNSFPGRGKAFCGNRCSQSF